ncbi:hypothetical protein IFO69_18285 [Echinicola sp. CAU 1574]|uniref:Lipoprotein n=1 Tax=Echinicola arenosa TaxID=2774144 RepID=A0ABR9APK1_9BACT|nr:hypothetical protein [Echinicola arenosa]MBD8490707.1 hypothetical protein [Echinicola arenosa]
MKRLLLSLFFIVMIFTLGIACTSKLDVGNINLENWKSDRDGCKGLRLKDLEEIKKIKNAFLEATNQELIVTFGRPDRVLLLDKSQSFFYYFLEPSDKCAGQDTEKEPLKVLFRMNAINKVSEVTITTLEP